MMEKCHNCFVEYGSSRFMSCSKWSSFVTFFLKGGAKMDQQKTGNFLKELRKEKGITQEQLAERFNTTNRSVSRWENGKNLPDISLLVEIADFYDVDIRELIDGERKSEMNKEELKEVAEKIADYEQTGKSKLLRWIRAISFVGVFLSALVIVLQTINFKPGISSCIIYILSLLIFVVMVILTLYTNGILAKIGEKKNLVIALKVTVLVIVGFVFWFMVKIMIIVGLVALAESTPLESASGIENYDKTEILEEYGSDLDTGLFLFPDNTEKMIEPSYELSLKTGMFDTDGYIILTTQYKEDDYRKEVARLSNISCTLEENGQSVTQQAKYDDTTYALPAYVTIDGYDYVYEYALLDESNNTIIYILLSYPEFVDLSEYQEYLKPDMADYDIDDVLEKFTIYAHSFNNGQSWLEYE